MKRLISSLIACWVAVLPAVTAAKEKLPKNTQIVYPAPDGSVVELRVLRGEFRKRLLVKTEWTFTREDVNIVNSLFDDHEMCQQDRIDLEGKLLNLMEEFDQTSTAETPFLSTTLGHWTLGISAASLVVGGVILGYNLKR